MRRCLPGGVDERERPDTDCEGSGREEARGRGVGGAAGRVRRSRAERSQDKGEDDEKRTAEHVPEFLTRTFVPVQA